MHISSTLLPTFLRLEVNTQGYVEQGKRGKSYVDQMALLAESRELGRQRTKDNAEGAGMSHTQG